MKAIFINPFKVEKDVIKLVTLFVHFLLFEKMYSENNLFIRPYKKHS